MHGNRKNGGLNGARAFGSLSILAISLKNVISRGGRRWRLPSSQIATDCMGDAWDNIDLMRRRLTI